MSEIDNPGHPGTSRILPVRVELIRESGQTLYARAQVDIRRKARIELPEHLPADLPEELILDMSYESDVNLEELLGRIMEHALKAALEEALDVEVDMGFSSSPAEEVLDAGEPVLDVYDGFDIEDDEELDDSDLIDFEEK